MAPAQGQSLDEPPNLRDRRQVLPDTQCGFRLINLKAWAALRLETNHFEIESEMLLAFVEAGYRVEFVPIQVIGRGRRSHIHPHAGYVAVAAVVEEGPVRAGRPPSF